MNQYLFPEEELDFVSGLCYSVVINQLKQF
jgi:hypothetical protein